MICKKCSSEDIRTETRITKVRAVCRNCKHSWVTRVLNCSRTSETYKKGGSV